MASRSQRPGGMGTSQRVSPDRLVPSMLSATRAPRALQRSIAANRRGKLNDWAPSTVARGGGEQVQEVYGEQGLRGAEAGPGEGQPASGALAVFVAR